MKSLMCILFLLIASWSAQSYSQNEPYINRVAVDPRLDVFDTGGRTQITYTNGDYRNPEILILICDSKTRGMEVQYSMFRDGYQVTTADYFTIQRYPVGWTKMTSPYYPPSVVIYDSGMGLARNRFADTVVELTDNQNWGFVFTFESIIEGHGIYTRAWSEIIPSYIFRRDLVDKDLSACFDIHSKTILPLLGLNHEK